MGGIESDFKFISYKVDKINFKLTPNVGILMYNGMVPSNKIQMAIRVKNPIYIRDDCLYLGGIEAKFHLLANDVLKEQTGKDSIGDIELGITGVFRAENGRFKKELEENLAKIQIPAILFPYLRSTFMTIMSNSGLGTVILPLINIHEVASQLDVNIKVIELSEKDAKTEETAK
jgi:preprotein translocase subunit SecB